ncbi:hypothetical protein APHAL10511_000375 [Amanita phalloides]|nr:hypothetical protein APHAL10511_000375 [Amanita phalloides]
MEVEHSEIDSIYEVCGALINEGFVVPSDGEKEEDMDRDTPSSSSSSQTPRSCTPSSSSLTASSCVQRGVSFDAATGLPIPPVIVYNSMPPVPLARTRILSYDASPEGYTHLDPTRPNPYIQYPCHWDRHCLKRVRGASPGHMQWHLRQVHRMNDRLDNKRVRCEHFIHQEDRVCGAEVDIKELGMHICDVHWSSRRVRCPFCGYWQVTRDDVPLHWLQSCPEYVSAEEEEQEAWKHFWKWPARSWSRSY